MERGMQGRYVVDSSSGETVRAYVPKPLPPVPPLLLLGPLARKHDQALIACGRLDALTALLPEPDLFLYAYVRREAVLSSQIEGTQSSLSDLLLFELSETPGVPFDDVVEVSNYVNALHHGLRRLQEGFPLSNRLLREMHGLLLSRGRGGDKQPGTFRRSQNWIGGTRPGNAHFVPPPPYLLDQELAHLEQFLHDDTFPYSPLVRAALAHVQFETLHPFLDGNGRIGRLLIALILHDEGVLSQPLLYLSLYLKQHRAMYYEMLDNVRLAGDWEAWLDFFLEGVHTTASNAVQTAHRLLELFREDTERIGALGRSASTALRAFALLRRHPLITINDLSAQAGISFATASRAINALQKMDVAREITGRQRERVYAYHRYIAILNEGAEV